MNETLNNSYRAEPPADLPNTIEATEPASTVEPAESQPHDEPTRFGIMQSWHGLATSPGRGLRRI